MMNERKNEMKVGDIVKSMDFPHIDNCYFIGKVVGISHAAGIFRAEFIKRVFDGVEDSKFKTDYFTAPLQGNSFMDDDSRPRVMVIG
jgi:hypothetical protein